MAKAPPAPAGKLFELPATTTLGLCVASRTLCVAEYRARIRRFEIDSGRELNALPIADAAWLGTARDRMVCASSAGFDVKDLDGNVLAALERPSNAAFTWRAQAIDRSGTIVCGTHGPSAYVWDARTGKIVLGYEDIGDVDIVPSPDGAMVAIVSGKKPMWIASTKDGALVELPEGRLRTRNQVAWAPDSSELVVYSYTQAVVFDVKARTAKARFKLLSPFTCLYVPVHDVFLCGGQKRISLWDATTWESRGEVPISAPQLATTEAGDRIITCSGDAPIMVWDAGQLIGSATTKQPKSPAAKPASS
jgi:WD40 repeat protein